MAVLALLCLTLLFPGSAFGEWKGETRVSVFFDRGDPANSIGILNDQFLEMGDIFEDYEVLVFEPDAIVFKDLRDGSPLKLLAEGTIDPKHLLHGRYLFVVKQLHTIRAAQIRYEREYHNGYAIDLETLMQHGYLKNGFENGVKHGYRFSIVKVGHTKPRFLEYQNLPTFYAIAEPVRYAGTKPYYFSVDHLDEVRFARSKESVSWGPVWEYSEVINTFSIRDLSVKEF